MSDSGIVLTRDQLNDWAGFPLTDEEVERLDAALARSSLPETIGTIAYVLRYEQSAHLGTDTASEGEVER